MAYKTVAVYSFFFKYYDVKALVAPYTIRINQQKKKNINNLGSWGQLPQFGNGSKMVNYP